MLPRAGRAEEYPNQIRCSPFGQNAAAASTLPHTVGRDASRDGGRRSPHRVCRSPRDASRKQRVMIGGSTQPDASWQTSMIAHDRKSPAPATRSPRQLPQRRVTSGCSTCSLVWRASGATAPWCSALHGGHSPARPCAPRRRAGAQRWELPGHYGPPAGGACDPKAGPTGHTPATSEYRSRRARPRVPTDWRVTARASAPGVIRARRVFRERPRAPSSGARP